MKKQPGFMMIEVIISMSMVAFISMFTVNLVMHKLETIKTLHEQHDIIHDLENQLYLKLINPEKKHLPQLLFSAVETKTITSLAPINSKSELKSFKDHLKILRLSYQQNKSLPAEESVFGLVAVSQKDAE
jgi:hypothetical protein